jgi:glutathione peroxidase
MHDSLYDVSVKGSDGKSVSMGNWRGKVLLIVNVASKCGFTPQYKGLEELHKKYASKGLVVLGFPCNQFGSQEPGTAQEIQSFCELNFGVTFPVLGKVEVNGAGADPLYQYLKKQKRGFLGISTIKWNFTKFLVARDGKVTARYAPTATPESLEADVVKLLG